MEIKFDDVIEGFGAVLKCPCCDGDYLHHTKVSVFARYEDAETGTFVSVDEDMSMVFDPASVLTQNPSPRRDGITIDLWCEYCHSKLKLNIFQHKGQTFFNILDDGKKNKPRK